MTYVSEYHAQFAKESMACQSLDNDEILNVRWATEDPNPTQKVAEKRRLEDMGQEAIRAKMDPRIVDAMRAVRALEEGDVLDDGYLDEAEDGPEGNSTKRRRIDEGYGTPSPPPEPPTQEPPKPSGLLSVDTLESLKYFAEIRKRNGLGMVAPKPPIKAPATGLNLADYGSDDE